MKPVTVRKVVGSVISYDRNKFVIKAAFELHNKFDHASLIQFKSYTQSILFVQKISELYSSHSSVILDIIIFFISLPCSVHTVFGVSFPAKAFSKPGGSILG